MGRILSIDYGEKRVGIALSDELKITAQPFDTIINDNINRTAETLAGIIKDKDVEKVVLGLPRNLKGEKGRQAEEVEKFRNVLVGKTDVPVVYQDEWLTSSEAKKILIKGGVKTGKNKSKVDKVAAIIILQNHLNSIT
jgi:putative Holliday junction resolvase